jgi:hypothetical protein
MTVETLTNLAKQCARLWVHRCGVSSRGSSTTKAHLLKRAIDLSSVSRTRQP